MHVARRRGSYIVALGLLIGAGAFNVWSRADERGSRIVFNPTPLPPEIGEWKSVRDNKPDSAVHDMLQEDAIQWRTYRRGQQYADLLVLYGHRKRTFHLPDSCLAGAGITIKTRQVVVLTMPDGSVVPFNALMLREGETSRIALYTFIGPGGSPTDLLGLNAGMLMCRIRGLGPKGAAIRVIGPVDPDKSLTTQPVCDLAVAALREVCKRVQQARPAREHRDPSGRTASGEASPGTEGQDG